MSETIVDLPGPKKKQAEALCQNVQWLCQTFGMPHVGMLTLTCGDKADGKFVKVSVRKEAERRFNNLLSNVIRKRYRCGVIVTERHKDNGIHFHLIPACDGDIASGFRWDDYDRLQAEVRARKRRGWRAVDVGASPALSAEWEFWRERAEGYGFGRCEMLPIRKNPEALGRYVAKYVGKTWEARKPEDKGARLVRYFGHWDDVKRREGAFARRPRWSANHGGLTPRARAWRECAKQAAYFAKGGFTEAMKKPQCWAWHFTKKICSFEFMDGDWQDEKTRQGILDHNREIHTEGKVIRGGWEMETEFWRHGNPPKAWESDVAIMECRRDNRNMVRITEDDVQAALDFCDATAQPPERQEGQEGR